MKSQRRGRKFKGVAAALALALAAGCFTGCGNNQGTASNGDGDMPKELSIFCALGPNVAAGGGTTFNDCMTFQLLEEETGCHVDWQHPASGAESERFNVMVVSGNYPDAIVYNWPAVKGGAQSYVDDEVIVDLTEYVEKCMPNFTEFLNKNPELKKDVYTDDGRILYIPFIRADKELCVFQGQVIREDWLEKLGLEKPKNTDELYEVLKAFKTKDPNGNGKADEIPMVATSFASFTGLGPLLWSFGTTYDFHLDDSGKVVYGPMTDQFREGLGYIAKLYREGLIDTDYLLDTRSKVDAKYTGDQAGFGFGFQPSTYYSAMQNSDAKVTGIEYIAGPDGKAYAFNPQYIQQVLPGCALAVTTANKNIAGTLKWIDNLYGGNGYMYANFGKEGVSYEMKDNEPVFTDYMTHNENGKSLAQMVGLTCGVRDSFFPMLQSWDYYKQTLQPWGVDAIRTWIAAEPDTSRTLPTTLSLTAEEGETYTEIMNQVETYFQEEANKVITGKTSIDDWNKVVEHLKEMGIQEAIDIKNAAYERYQKR